jgi:hypothetical protein
MITAMKNDLIAKRHYKFVKEAFRIFISYKYRTLYPAPKPIAPVIGYFRPAPVPTPAPVTTPVMPTKFSVTQFVKTTTPSTFIGTKGKIEKELNLNTIVTYASRARRGSFIVLKDEQNRELSWLCPYYYRVGDNIVIKDAFIYDHKEYKGVKQTVVSSVIFTKK